MTEKKYKPIAYAQNSPNLSMLKYHYDLWKKEGLTNEMTIVIIGTITVVPLLLTLLIALASFLIRRFIKD